MLDFGCVGCEAVTILDADGLCRKCRGDGDGDERTCVECGCTEDNPCPGGCSWFAPGICTSCA